MVSLCLCKQKTMKPDIFLCYNFKKCRIKTIEDKTTVFFVGPFLVFFVKLIPELFSYIRSVSGIQRVPVIVKVCGVARGLYPAKDLIENLEM